VTASVRDRLLAVSAATCAELGWRDSTIDRLCEQADVSHHEFYLAFDTMDDLFLEMYERHTELLLAATDRAVAGAVASRDDGAEDGLPPDREAVVRALAAVVGSAAGDRTWWILTTEYMLRAVRHPEIAERYRSVRRRTHRHVAAIVRGALAGPGGAQPAGDSEVDVDRLVEVTLALQRGSVASSFLEPGAMSPEEMSRLAWPAILRAVSTTS
jgi:AcrR family transcriptional regulator